MAWCWHLCGTPHPRTCSFARARPTSIPTVEAAAWWYIALENVWMRGLPKLSASFAAVAAALDHGALLPYDNLAELHSAGLLALTVLRALGGRESTLTQVLGAVARGEPSTALILVMQYLYHLRLQAKRSRVAAARTATLHAASIQRRRAPTRPSPTPPWSPDRLPLPRGRLPSHNLNP
jgi:alkylation response protein AidB-like acyl-CoA dehydrogenase